MCKSLKKKVKLEFMVNCIKAINELKRKLTEDLILIAPDWNLTFDLMCDISDITVGKY